MNIFSRFHFPSLFRYLQVESCPKGASYLLDIHIWKELNLRTFSSDNLWLLKYFIQMKQDILVLLNKEHQKATFHLDASIKHSDLMGKIVWTKYQQLLESLIKTIQDNA